LDSTPFPSSALTSLWKTCHYLSKRSAARTSILFSWLQGCPKANVFCYLQGPIWLHKEGPKALEAGLGFSSSFEERPYGELPPALGLRLQVTTLRPAEPTDCETRWGIPFMTCAAGRLDLREVGQTTPRSPGRTYHLDVTAPHVQKSKVVAQQGELAPIMRGPIRQMWINDLGT